MRLRHFFCAFCHGALVSSLSVSALDASMVTSGPFAGDLTEGFESTTPHVNVQSLRGFDDNATISTGFPNETFRVAGPYSGGEFGGSISPVEGNRQVRVGWTGQLDVLFDAPVESFGGYFSSLFNTASTSSVTFYNQGSVVDTKILSVGFGSWVWNGWSATNGISFDKVTINHDRLISGSPYENGWFLVDDLRATSLSALDSSAVPEPVSIAMWSVLGGVGIFAQRRRRKTATV